MFKINLSLVLLFCHILLRSTAEAQTKKEIVSQMQEAIGKYECFLINYQLDFKFQSKNDTNTKIITVVCSTKKRIPAIGYAKIIDGDSFNYNLAYNRQEFVVIDETGIYSNGNCKEHKNWYRTKINDNFYRPFLLETEFYKNFTLIGINSQDYLLMRTDSTAGQAVYQTIVSVSKTTFLPMLQEEWNWFDGGVQYRRSTLLSIEKISGKEKKMISHKSDSLIRLYKTFINGDSMYEAHMARFKELKPGDLVKNFTGHIHGTSDSVEISNIKDSIIILDFSYTTCGPCAAAIPGLNAINIQYRDRGVKLLSVNHMSQDWPRLDKFIEFFKPNFQVLKVEQIVAIDYGVKVYPTLIIIKNGVVRFVKYGTEDFENVLKREIDKLL